MHQCAAHQIRVGHLLFVDDDMEEVLDVMDDVDDDRIMYVATRNVTSLSSSHYTLMRHAEVTVE